MTGVGAAQAFGDAFLPLQPKYVFGVFVVFCRVGACMMLTPGVSSPQIPVQVRLLIAVAVSLSLSPILIDAETLGSLDQAPVPMLRTIAFELAIGVLIGLLGRLFFLGLEAIASSAATMLGFSNPLGIEVEPGEALSPFATFVVTGGTALIFFSDLHLEILRGLSASYHTIPIGTEFNSQYALRSVADVLSLSFRTGLRVCSPFFVYVVIVNLAMSLVSRVTPQVSIFYISMPFTLAGALVLLYFTVKPILDEFETVFGAWLTWG